LERARNPADRGATERQIGRFLGRNSRAAGRYAIRVIEDKAVAAGLRLEWSARAEWDEWSAHSEGCYVLRTNVSDWTPEALWRTYIQLTQAEAAFRIHKSELSIRPIWHQRETRVLAHILVCFLTYVLWKTLEQWQSRAGLGNAPRTILQELAAITTAPTSSCRSELRRNATCACAASFAPIAPRSHCSTASDCTCRNDSACASPNTSRRIGRLFGDSRIGVGTILCGWAATARGHGDGQVDRGQPEGVFCF
ncbi:MAG: hypothetical protein ACREFS_12235, partial [Acetobacteraceae bacterium]